MEGVRLLDQAGLNARWAGSRGDTPIQLFESGSETRDKQAVHTVDATQLLEWELKDCLLGLVRDLFGPGELKGIELDRSNSSSLD